MKRLWVIIAVVAITTLSGTFCILYVNNNSTEEFSVQLETTLDIRSVFPNLPQMKNRHFSDYGIGDVYRRPIPDLQQQWEQYLKVGEEAKKVKDHGVKNADGDHKGCTQDNVTYHRESTCGIHHVENDFGRMIEIPLYAIGCRNWMVTVATPQEVKAFASKEWVIPNGWCCMVVVPNAANLQIPVCRLIYPHKTKWKSARNLVGMSVSNAWKNIGFLEAIDIGAEVIADVVSLAVLVTLTAMPVLPEKYQMAGEYDTDSNFVNPYAHFGASGCPYMNNAEDPFAETANSNPYFIFNDGGGMRYFPIQYPLVLPYEKQFQADQSECLCRVSWNNYHSKCRRRFKRCTYFSTNHPVTTQTGTLAYSKAVDPTHQPIKVVYKRAFWALLAVPENPQPTTTNITVTQIVVDMAFQKVLWGILGHPLFYNASHYYHLKHNTTTNRPIGHDATSPQQCYNDQQSQDTLKEIADMITAHVFDERNVLARVWELAVKLRSLDFQIAMHDWIIDLFSASYTAPALYSPPKRQLNGAIITLLDESMRDIMKHIWYWNRFRFALLKNYPFWLFYIAGTLTNEEKELLKERTPGFIIKFIPVQYSLPRQYWANHLTWTKNGTKGYGYLYCSQFLGYELFKHPLMSLLKYYYRIDEDTQAVDFVKDGFDPFTTSDTNGYLFSSAQLGIPSIELDNTLSDRTWKYITTTKQKTLGFEVSEAWNISQAYFHQYKQTAWDRYVYAGCVELAKVSVYKNEHYWRYLWKTNWLDGVYLHQWLEQAFKTTWAELYVPPRNWTYMCEMVVRHKLSMSGWECNHTALQKPDMLENAPILQLLAGGFIGGVKKSKVHKTPFKDWQS